MRIHRAFVVLAIIGTILLTWYLRTKDMDFITPKGGDLASTDGDNEFIDPLAEIQPEIKDQPNVHGDIEQPKDPDLVEEPTVKKITEEELGDLASSPGLETYRDFARQNEPERLFELSATLRARGEFQRALLAFERIIDTCLAEPKALAEASSGITALTPNLPRWNVDPTQEVSLNLHLGTARKASEPLKKAVLEVALLIRESSGDQLDIIPTINSGDQPDAPETSPIALWLATPGDDPTSSAVITLRLPPEIADPSSEIALAVYKAIRSHLTQQGYPAPPESDTPGKELLSRQITRLMWRDFAQSLLHKEEEEASETTEEETSPEPN